ncbi:MAG: cupin domain-containing protein [Haloferacaceae archaeon]
MDDAEEGHGTDEREGAAAEEGHGTDEEGGAVGYRRVALSDLPDGLSPARSKKELDEAVGARAFGCNVYGADAGEQLPWGYHRHPDHEELFYVIEGELAVDTPEGTYRVGADEAFFVPPDRRNRARAAADGTRVVAVGAPKADDGAIIEEECPACGERTRLDPVCVDGADETGDDVPEGSPAYALRCADCGTEVRRIG